MENRKLKLPIGIQSFEERIEDYPDTICIGLPIDDAVRQITDVRVN